VAPHRIEPPELKRPSLVNRIGRCIYPALAYLDAGSLRRQLFLAQLAGFLGVIAFTWLSIYIPGALSDRPFDPQAILVATANTIWILLLLAFTLGVTHVFLSRLSYLEGFLPVCSHCKSIRVNDHWEPLEAYMYERTDLKLTHSLCPACAKLHYDYEE
jgi:hypothetical protein